MQFLIENRFGILSILILFGAFNGYLLTILFLLSKRRREYANRIFGFFIMIISLRLTEMACNAYGIIWKVPFIAGITWPLFFLLGPLFWLYTNRLLNPSFRISWRHSWMALPALIKYIHMWSWITMDLSQKSEILKQRPAWESTELPLQVYIELGLAVAHTSVYLFFAFLAFKRHQSLFKDEASDNRAFVRLSWLQKLTFGSFAYTSMYFVVYLFLVFWHEYRLLVDRGWSLLLSFMMHAIGYVAIEQPEYFAGRPSLPDSKGDKSLAPKYRKSALSKEQANHYMEILTRYMNEQRPYLEDDLKASELANAVNIPIHHLSQVLSQECGLNFFDFVNSYRIEEVKRLLQDPSRGQLTFLALAYEAGFNNKASFNRAFKKFTGKTPTAFLSANPRESIS